MIKKYGRTLIFILIFFFLIGCASSKEIRGREEVKPEKEVEQAKKKTLDELKTRMDSLMATQEKLFEKGAELGKKIDSELERTKDITEYLQKKEKRLKKELVVLKEKEEVAQIRIGVLNGCGEKGMAERLKTFLMNKGFNIRKTGNADNFKYRKSIVYYNERFRKEAIDIAHKIPGWQDIYKMKVEKPDVDISIIVGRDLIKSIK